MVSYYKNDREFSIHKHVTVEGLMNRKVLLAVLICMVVMGITPLFSSPQKGVTWISSYLRSEPVMSNPVKGNVIKIVPKETKIDLLKFDKGWFLIELDDSTEGWIYRKLIRVFDENGNEMADYDPYEDKGWKVGDAGIKSDTHASPDKPVVIPPATAKSTSDKPAVRKPARAKLPASLDKQIKIADSLVKIGCRIDSINQTVSVLKDDLKNKESVLNDINARIQALESRDSTLSAKMEVLSQGKQNYTWLIALVLLAFILMAILIPMAFRRSKTLVQQAKIEQENMLDHFSGNVNTNFVRLSVSSRKDYQELMDSLTLLALIDESRIQVLMEESSGTKGMIDKMNPDILQTSTDKDFMDNLSLLLNIYMQYDPMALRNKKVSRLNDDMSGILQELKQHLNSKEEPHGKASKSISDWFKSLQTAMDGIGELSEDFKVMISSGKYTNLLNQLKKNFPGEAANISLNLQNKKWKNAQSFLEKMEFEKVKVKD